MYYAKGIKKRRTRWKTKNISIKRSKGNIFASLKRIFISVIVICAIAGAAKMCIHLLTSPMYNIQKINISGNKLLEKSDILRLCSIKIGSNIFTVRLSAMAKVIKNNPQIESVRIHRFLPATININIIERKPIGFVNSGKILQVDENAVLFPAFPVKLPDYPLYFIENFQCSASDIGKKLDREELKESILILKELEEKKYVFKEKLVTCDVQETQNIVLHFESSPYTVQLGRGNMDVKLAKLNALLDNLSKNNKSAKYIDFRFRDEAVVKLN